MKRFTLMSMMSQSYAADPEGEYLLLPLVECDRLYRPCPEPWPHHDGHGKSLHGCRRMDGECGEPDTWLISMGVD